MDLSAIIVAVLGILFFFGGAAWLEIRSRKNKAPGLQGKHSSRQAAPTASVEGTVRGREAESG